MRIGAFSFTQYAIGRKRYSTISSKLAAYAMICYLTNPYLYYERSKNLKPPKDDQRHVPHPYGYAGP